MSDRLDKAIAAFRGVEPHAIINRAALFAVINAERNRCRTALELAKKWLDFPENAGSADWTEYQNDIAAIDAALAEE